MRAEHAGRCVGRPFSDRRRRFRACQHRARGERENEGEGADRAPSQGRSKAQDLWINSSGGRAKGVPSRVSDHQVTE
ncbi:hypothetical protein SCOCK_300080 [Actinacidiphila cocklensis]|uniref:Uncharacterized protein n=1 Tax=Actinacidiphila cocklensis TaxID=887465 RepID=A0A9W4GSF5_9ACTN|nr:hypothetical protein SCOCK_300080 [Actinacidiphila cocklensis]